MISRIATIALGSVLSLWIAPGAMAGRVVPEHPRVNEVNQRLTNQQHRVAEGVAHAQIGRWQAARDMRRDERIERQLRRDEAWHDGHVTVAEQHRLNQELDRNSVRIYDERH
jgi:hypothetical protein